MTMKDKASLFHELFPNDVSVLVSYCRTMAEEIQTGRRIVRLWLPHSASPSWTELAGECLGILQQYQQNIQMNALAFGNYLFRKRIFYFTRYCLQNYIDYKYTTDPRLITAIHLFLL